MSPHVRINIIVLPARNGELGSSVAREGSPLGGGGGGGVDIATVELCVSFYGRLAASTCFV